MSSSSRQQLESWLATIDVAAVSVLDIGGSQKPVKGRTKSWDAHSYKILDLPSPHIDSPKPDFAADINEPWSKTDFVIFQADVVFCLEVFDYVWNPAVAFKNIAGAIYPDGKAYVSFPFIYPHHNPIEDDALRYAGPVIGKLAQYAGLSVASLEPRRANTNLLERTYAAEGMRAAKGFDHSVTGWLAEFRK